MRRRQNGMRREPTIALVNIVFLMLVFFMVAGTLSRPLEADFRLVRTAELEGRAPPDTLVVHADGRMVYRGETVLSIEEFYTARPKAEREKVRIVPDEALSATTLVNLAQDLRTAGALSVVIVTQRGLN